MIDLDDGTFVDCNEQALKHLGYTRDELIGMAVPQVERKISTYDEWLAEINQLESHDRMTLDGEHQTKDGRSIPVEVTTELVEHDENQFVLARVTRKDNLDRSQDFHELFLQYDRFFKNAPVGLAEFDASNLYHHIEDLQASEVDDFESYFDREKDRIVQFLDRIEFGRINETLLEIFDADDRSEFTDKFPHFFKLESYDTLKSLLLELVNEQVRASGKLKIETLDNHTRWIEVKFVNPEGMGEYYSEVYISLEDITERIQNQVELQQREENYRNLVSNVPGIVYRCNYDDDWTMEFISKRVSEITGYQADKFIDNKLHTYASIIHPDDRDEVVETVQDAVEEGEDFAIEYRIVRKDDDIVWVYGHGEAQYDENGSVKNLQGVVLDITNRKKAEEKLQESEQRFRSIFEQATVGIAHVEPDGTLSMINDKFSELLGYDKDELRGETFQSLTHPEDLDKDLQNLEQLKQGEIDQYTIEKRYIRKNKEILWVRLTVGAVRGADSEPKYFVSVVEDITERKETEEELEKSEKRLRKLATTVDQVFYIYDLDNEELRYLGPDFEDVWGRSIDEVDPYPEGLLELIHPEDHSRVLSEMPSRIELPSLSDEDSKLEFRIEHPNGEIRWIRDRAFPFKDDSENSEMIAGTYEDITERKKTERELIKSEQKFQQIASNIDHVIWLKDPETEEFEFVNTAHEEIWGQQVDELYENKRAWFEMIHEEDRKRLEGDLIDKQKRGDFHEEYRIVRPDGEIRWIEDRAFPIRDEDGDIEKIAGIAEDITERKTIKKERESFFDLTLDLFALADREGTFIEVNQAFVETLGYSKQELESKPYTEFVHPEDREQTLDAMDKLNEGQRIANFENRYLTNEGNYRWLSWRARPGKNVIYAVARDITEQKQYEKQLQSMIEEKEILLKEVHHRVKNNLQIISSLLDMQRRKVDSEKFGDSLQNSIDRVKSMALIHEQLYQSKHLSSVNLENYLEELVERQIKFRSGSDENVVVNTDIDLGELGLDVAIPSGLILNELISNALDHGTDDNEELRIDIEFTIENDRKGKIIVYDNGEGFPDDFDIDRTESLGMRIVQSLAEYELEGDVRIENNDGAQVVVTFPIESHDTLTETNV